MQNNLQQINDINGLHPPVPLLSYSLFYSSASAYRSALHYLWLQSLYLLNGFKENINLVNERCVEECRLVADGSLDSAETW